MALAAFRAQFPHTERLVYLDNAGRGPLPLPAVEAMRLFLEERSLTDPNNHWAALPRIERARARLAAMMGAPVARVDFSPNTSYALNVLALGYPWQPGDRVAVPACEFPANLHPWLQLRAQGVGVDLIGHTDGVVTVDDVARALTPTTRVVAVSWVQFLSGDRIDLAALADVVHAHGALLAVDAMQGLGAFRLDAPALGLDFVACGAQKWLLGMQGVAFLYVTEELQERLRPVRGWLNGPVDWDNFFTVSEDLHPDAMRFRVGTLASGPIVALDASLGLLLDLDAGETEAQVLAMARRIADGLDGLGLARFGTGGVPNSGIVTTRHPAPEDAHARLQAAGIHLALRDRKLRFAPHAYTTEADVDRALEAVAATLRV